MAAADSSRWEKKYQPTATIAATIRHSMGENRKGKKRGINCFSTHDDIREIHRAEPWDAIK
jgi:hypothetical protein